MRGPDRWLALTVLGPPDREAGGLVPEGLVALGGRAVEEEGPGRWTTYLPAPEDPEAFAGLARRRLRALTGLNELEVAWFWQDHEDWAYLWRRDLGARRIGARIVVTPTWENPALVSEGDVVVRLDPGMAFGTAEHATTRGCLRLLQEALREDDEVLDLGTGSAILAIAAALLGARRVQGVEVDPLACEVARENVRANGVLGRVRLREMHVGPESIASLGAFDGILANLETGVLLPLLPGLADVVRPGGWIVVSGVRRDDARRIREGLEEVGPRLAREDREGGWWTGLFRRALRTRTS